MKYEFYKKIDVRGKEYFLFDALEKINGKWELIYIRVTEDIKGNYFKVESGACKTRKRMLSQINKYFKIN